MAQTAPYGSWKSPITADLISSSSLKMGEVRLDSGNLYWSESRPQEKGRYALMGRSIDGEIKEIVPAPYSVRSGVNEYGGGAYAVAAGTVYFSNSKDQRIYVVEEGQSPRPLTPENKDLRFADFTIDFTRGLLYCVVEDHSGAGEELHYLASIDLEDGEIQHMIDEGNDFYGYLTLCPDNDKIAYLTWNHPNMPWDGCELWVAQLDEQGRPHSREFIAGGWEESVTQPKWSPDGCLYFISDRNNWWNLYRWESDGVLPILEMDADFAWPQWVFGLSNYGFTSSNTIYCTYTQNGLWYFGMIAIEAGKLTALESPYTYFTDVWVAEDQIVCLAGSPQISFGVSRFDIWDDKWETIQLAEAKTLDLGYLSQPTGIEFPTSNDLTAYGLYYPPMNKDFIGPAEERPGLIVISHGGPTSAARSHLDLKDIQYWTSRGFAVLDVNYSGSIGYGRAYRTRLNGNWGILDRQDCEAGAQYLVAQELVDPARLIIRGESAGGYTTLCALTFGNTFKAGASHYGIGDLTTLATHTHKFEARYLDSMVGKWPEDKEIYENRSPIYHTNQLNCPVILLQGLDDKVVPPEQSQSMFDAVRAKGLRTAYLAFEGEGHGFRQGTNIKRALEAELYFYSKVFDFELAEEIEPVKIENL